MASARFFSEQMMEVAFAGDVPDWFERNLDHSQIEDLVDSFKLVFILPFEASRPIRVSWSAQGEEERWRMVVRRLLPEWQQSWLSTAPEGSRLMLDFDGESGEVFFDDLHRGTTPTDQMCRVYSLCFDRFEHIRKTKAPLAEEVPSSVLHTPLLMGCLAISGMWGIRENEDGKRRSLLWVSEAKWKGNHEDCCALLDRCAPPASWNRLRAKATELGRVMYPDGIEFFWDGRIDVSVAFL